MTPGRIPDADTKRAEFERVALPLLGVLHATAWRLTRGGDEAADLVQETCLPAYRTFDNFVPGTNSRGWLLTILYSVFYNSYHKARRTPTTVSIDDLDARYQHYLESPDDTGASATTQPLPGAGGIRVSPEVAVALGELPDEFRSAVLHVDVVGASYDEAALALGCPVGTVRSRLFRGRRLLFAALHEYAVSMGFARGER